LITKAQQFGFIRNQLMNTYRFLHSLISKEQSSICKDIFQQNLCLVYSLAILMLTWITQDIWYFY